MNPVISILEYRAKLGEPMSTSQIMDDIGSWFYVDDDKVFRDAVREGLIVKDGKDDLGEDLWVLANCSIKKQAPDKNLPSAEEMMTDADAYAKKRAAERARLNSQPTAKTEHDN